MRQTKRSFHIIYLTLFAFLLTFCVTNSYAGFEVDVSLTTISGATDSSSFATSFKLSGNQMCLSGNFRHSEVDNIKSEEKGALRIGYDPKINESWGLWFFEQVGYNDAINLKFENLAGFGPRWILWARDKDSLGISAGIVTHCTRFKGKSSEQLLRYSVRQGLSLAWDKTSFTLKSSYMSDIEDSKDYILAGEMSLRYSLTDVVGLKLKITEEHRSVLDEKNELTTTLALSIKI